MQLWVEPNLTCETDVASFLSSCRYTSYLMSFTPLHFCYRLLTGTLNGFSGCVGPRNEMRVCTHLFKYFNFITIISLVEVVINVVVLQNQVYLVYISENY